MDKQNSQLSIDFIGIGAPKSATSWIFQCLKEHPQVCVSKEKETDFFAREKDYQKGLDYYQSFFNHCSDQSIKGEFCADYLAASIAPDLIKKHYPDTKIIACLRNPIERAYSHYYYDIARGKINCTFEQSFEKIPAYLKEGHYHKHLKRYYDLFPKENILVLIYEDIDKDPLKIIQQVYSFLKINQDFIPPSLKLKINLTSENKLFVPWFNDVNLKKNINALKKNFIGQQIINLSKITKLSSVILFLKRKNLKDELDASQKSLSRPSINPQTREYLRRLYQDGINNLEKLINRDLGFWN